MKLESRLQTNNDTIKMRKVTYEEYLEFVKKNKEIEVEGNKIKLKPIEVKRLHPTPECITSSCCW